MTVSSIRSRDFKRDDFTGEEIDAMRRETSSAATMTKVRSDAGLGGSGVAMRGDDKTSAELRKEWNDHDLEDATHASVRDALLEGLEGTLLHAAGPFIFAIEAVGALHEARERGEALAASHERGAMHLAMLTALDLPQSYKNVEVGRWKEAGTGTTSGAMKLGVALETFDKKDAAILQLHADRGMSAARSLIDAGVVLRDGGAGEVTRALAADPALKSQYDSDAAFRAGFDGLVWVKQHDAPAAYDQAIEHFEARDARYTQHAISVRG